MLDERATQATLQSHQPRTITGIDFKLRKSYKAPDDRIRRDDGMKAMTIKFS